MIAPVRPAPPRVVAVDPGSVESGVVVFDPVCSEPVVYAAKLDNVVLVAALRIRELPGVSLHGPHVLVVEMIASYGMPVGREVFETCVVIGRCLEAWSGRAHRVYRREVKEALCHSPKANDATVRRALLDRFGGDAARGTKKAPGPLYGVKSDAWSALALAVTYCETNGRPAPVAGKEAM